MRPSAMAGFPRSIWAICRVTQAFDLLINATLYAESDKSA